MTLGIIYLLILIVILLINWGVGKTNKQLDEDAAKNLKKVLRKDNETGDITM